MSGTVNRAATRTGATTRAAALSAGQARAVLSAAERAWHRRDLDALVAALHPDVRIRFNSQPEIRGLDTARAWLKSRFDAQRDYRLKKTLRGVDGSMIVSSWVGRWRDERTGGPLCGRGIELLTIDNGLIRDWDAVMHGWPECES